MPGVLSVLNSSPIICSLVFVYFLLSKEVPRLGAEAPESLEKAGVQRMTLAFL